MRPEVAEPELLPADLPAGAPPGIGEQRIGPFHGLRRVHPVARTGQRGDEVAKTRRIDPGDPRVRRATQVGVGRRVVRLGGAGQGDLHRIEDSGQRAQCRHARADRRSRVSARAASFTESVIREMTRHATLHDAVNLAQGFPDFPCPPELKEAAKAAIDADINQYAITWGARDFREAIAAKTARCYPGWPVDPETDLTVTCGATEGMIAAMLALVDPGDEVIVFEPFYENYGPDAILSGAVPRYVTLHEPDWRIDADELRAAFGPRTRAIILNSPHNPTGKVFSRAELELIAGLAQEHDALVLTDDIYEHIVYRRRARPDGDPAGHGRADGGGQLAVEDVLGDRLARRLGRSPPPPLTSAIRKVHDFLTVGAAAPLQAAGAVALALPDAYYAHAGRRLPPPARPACSVAGGGRAAPVRARTARTTSWSTSATSPTRTTSPSPAG